MTASSVFQTLSLILSKLSTKEAFSATIYSMVLNRKGDDRFPPWNQFLNLLEGTHVNMAMLKNLSASDWERVALQPIFPTSSQRIVEIINRKINCGETDQIKEKWNYIESFYQCIKGETDYSLCLCARCFVSVYGVTN